MSSATGNAVRTVVGSFEVTSWEEEPLDDRGPDQKLTRAVVRKTYTGNATGMSLTEWLMAYAPDGTATFVGMERFTGEIDGRRGSVVFQHVGRFADGAARGSIDVVAGTGTGELIEANGAGDFLADPAGSITLDVAFA